MERPETQTGWMKCGLVRPDPSILAASIEILDQGCTLLAALSDGAYTERMPMAYNASIGGHYRHCLDHFHSIALGAGDGVVDYDRRRRDPVIENDRFAAINETRRLRDVIAGLGEAVLGEGVRVLCKTSYSACGTQQAKATVGRELMYAVAHAVHHYALIGIMAKLQGVSLPEGFGVAPSTLRHQQALATQETSRANG